MSSIEQLNNTVLEQWKTNKSKENISYIWTVISRYFSFDISTYWCSSSWKLFWQMLWVTSHGLKARSGGDKCFSPGYKVILEGSMVKKKYLYYFYFKYCYYFCFSPGYKVILLRSMVCGRTISRGRQPLLSSPTTVQDRELRSSTKLSPLGSTFS